MEVPSTFVTKGTNGGPDREERAMRRHFFASAIALIAGAALSGPLGAQQSGTPNALPDGAGPVGQRGPAPPLPAQRGDEPDGGEALTRGPLHEAFAEPVPYNPRPGIIVPKAPPAA